MDFLFIRNSMIRDIILQQKKEKEMMLSRVYIEREKIPFMQKFLDTDLIKIITGPRRAGKSSFAFLSLKNRNFGYLNFDDENLLKFSGDEIIKGIFEVYKKPDIILFDEIQNFADWEIFVNKLQRRGFNLILTGSNAKLLSRELSTLLTGRHIPIEILPFSFREFLKSKNFEIEEGLPQTKGEVLNYLNEFIKNGGFPEVIVKSVEAKTYLDTLADSILLKDVVKRYKVKLLQKIYELFLYMASNFTNEYTFTRLKNILNFNSTRTIENYLRYLEEAYLIFSLNRFSYKIKEQIKTPRKVYLVDNGFIQAKAFMLSQDYGRLMENLFFQELLKKGLKVNENVFYYKTRNQKEVDFVLKEGIEIKELIQVVYDIADYNVKKREMGALIEASEELRCDNLTIITWDTKGEENIKNRKIKIIPLWQYLTA